MAHQPKTLSKVPEVTAYFWIIKILTTGMGETTSDYFIHRVGLTNTVGLLAVATITGLALGPERGVRVLVRLHRDQAARSLARGPAGRAEDAQRPRLGLRGRQRGPRDRHPRAGELPDGHARGRPEGGRRGVGGAGVAP